MKRLLLILSCIVLVYRVAGKEQERTLYFYGDTLKFTYPDTTTITFNTPVTTDNILLFWDKMGSAGYEKVVDGLKKYHTRNQPDDWVFYQLIRKVAQQMCAKETDYNSYTLHKWFLLNKCGYNATLNITDNKLLLYVQSDENIYDIPFYKRDNKQYICLNFHDHPGIDVKAHPFTEVPAQLAGAVRPFSYQLKRMPNFAPSEYQEKELDFNYNDRSYVFRVKVPPAIQSIYKNYPVADYKLYFNAPLSSETYNTLIPQLKEQVRGMSVKNGVDYLMKFTRYAFLYQPDAEQFGKEKRMSPEQTLLADKSDCEDRAALFYCLVKEIYNLPMVVIEFPHHLTIAVKFEKPVGKPIYYNGAAYTVCEPTPQQQELGMGEISYELTHQRYSIALAYDPQ